MKKTVKNLITWSPSHLITSPKSAFTLAEVLITLAIIGVVAAMTIPTLLTNFQKKATAVRVKKAYAEYAQAIKLSEVDNGPMQTWNMTIYGNVDHSRRIIEKYLTPYFSGINECDQVNDKYCGLKASHNGLTYKLKNGTVISFYPTLIMGKYAIMTVITTNPTEKPVMGRDAFYFEAVDGKVQPAFYKAGLTRDEIIYGYRLEGYNYNEFHVSCKAEPIEDLGTDETTGATIIDDNRTACTALLFVDGFEFKEDYPW